MTTRLPRLLPWSLNPTQQGKRHAQCSDFLPASKIFLPGCDCSPPIPRRRPSASSAQHEPRCGGGKWPLASISPFLLHLHPWHVCHALQGLSAPCAGGFAIALVCPALRRRVSEMFCPYGASVPRSPRCESDLLRWGMRPDPAVWKPPGEDGNCSNPGPRDSLGRLFTARACVQAYRWIGD